MPVLVTMTWRVLPERLQRMTLASLPRRDLLAMSATSTELRHLSFEASLWRGFELKINLCDVGDSPEAFARIGPRLLFFTRVAIDGSSWPNRYDQAMQYDPLVIRAVETFVLSLPRLSHLSIIGGRHLKSIVERCNLLTSFKMVYTSHFTSDLFDGCFSEVVTRHKQSLQHLELDGLRGPDTATVLVQIARLENLASLDVLVRDGSQTETAWIEFCERSSSAGSLTKLTLKRAQFDVFPRGLNNECCSQLASRFVNLRHLKINIMSAVTDTGMFQLSQMLNLQHLEINIAWSFGITEAGLGFVVSRQSLTYLEVDVNWRPRFTGNFLNYRAVGLPVLTVVLSKFPNVSGDFVQQQVQRLDGRLVVEFADVMGRPE